jgi:hypothetical protein
MSSFLEHTGAVLVAIGDAFPDQLEQGRRGIDEQSAKFGKPALDPSKLYKGLNAYQSLFADKDVDAVYSRRRPGSIPRTSRPRSAAGKHIYLEKPVAVDVPGAKSWWRSARRRARRQAEPRGGFQIRHASPYVELAKRVPAGEIARRVRARSTTSLGDQAAEWPDATPAARPAATGSTTSPLSATSSSSRTSTSSTSRTGAEGEPGEGGRLASRAGRTDHGRLQQPLQLRLHLPGQRARQLRLDAVPEREVGGSRHAVLRDEGLGRGALRRAGADLGRERWEFPASRSPSPRRGRGGDGAFRGALDDADPNKREGLHRGDHERQPGNEAQSGVDSALACMLGREAAATGKEVHLGEAAQVEDGLRPRSTGSRFA